MSVSITALIVEDDRATQRLLADALAKRGFATLVEHDGEWGLKTFKKRDIDVVLLDLALPGMDGLTVAKAMAKEKPDIPIVLMSGVYPRPDDDAIRACGASEFLAKPLRVATLHQALRSVLGGRYPERTNTVTSPALGSEEPAITDSLDPQAREEAAQVEATDPASATLLRGNFRTKPFAALLAELYRAKTTGALLLRRGRVKKIVYFREGVPVLVKSNLLSECLGRVMVRERMLGEPECEESLRRMKASGRQQGTTLVEMGCISPHNLVHALTLQLQYKLFEIFSWHDGDYQLNSSEKPPATTAELGLSTAAVIHDGISRTYDEARTLRELGEVDLLYPHPSEEPLYALQDIGLDDDERALLGQIDGQKTVREVRALGILLALDADRFLYAMKCTQMVELHDTPSLTRKRAPLADDPPPGSQPVPPPLPPKKRPQSTSVSTSWSSPPVPDSEPDTQPPVDPPTQPTPGVLLPELGQGGLPSRGGGVERERLLAKIEELKQQDFFERLGVDRTSNREKIKRSYFSLAREYHPDKHFASASREIRQLAAQVYEMLSAAHDTLTQPEERQAYEASQPVRPPEAAREDYSRILAAEGKFQKGEQLLREGHANEATQHFREAISLFDGEGEFHAYLGWSLFQSKPGDRNAADAALESLDRAVGLNPRLDRGYLFAGFIYKALGKPMDAERQFERAIQCNPDCTEALHELRLLGRPRR